MKVSQKQLSKCIRSSRFIGALLGKLPGPLIKLGVSFSKIILASLVTVMSAIDYAIQRKIYER